MTTPHEPTGIVEDDRLRLIFTCCHPALAPEARVALTLRLLGGLTVAEIAQAFLVPETTMAQRITRAKKKISVAKIPYRVPRRRRPRRPRGRRARGPLPGLQRGLPVHLGRRVADPRRADRRGDPAGRILRGLLPDVPEVTGLLALMLLTEARRSVRVAGGELVPLHEQDRGGWDRALIAEGHDLVRECLAIGRPGQYQILAAVNAVHTDAADRRATPTGPRSRRSTSSCTPSSPSPIVALNRAVAVAEASTVPRSRSPRWTGSP